MDRTVKIGSRKVDLAKAYPLTLGDARALKALGVDILNLTNLDIDQIISFVGYVGRKAEPALTNEDVESTPIQILADLAAKIGVENNEEGKDADFLASSTSSAENMAGQRDQSKH